MPLSVVVRFCRKCLLESGLTYGNPLRRESAMMFSVPLMCCEYRDVSLLTSIHPSHRATASWDSAFTGSKDALCIQPSALELSVNARMCEP